MEVNDAPDRGALLLWRTSSKATFIKENTATHSELREYAVTRIQPFWRFSTCTSDSEQGHSTSNEQCDDDDDDETNDGEEGSDDNSSEAVAVRLALMASTVSFHSSSSSSSASCEEDDVDIWPYERILKWVADTIDAIAGESDRTKGANMFWKEWQATAKHIPASARRKFVGAMDEILHAKGFPSLRELVQIL